MFTCPNCKKELKNFHPDECVCGYRVPQVDSVYQFCDDPAISLDRIGHRYLGYEDVGENYRPSIAFGEDTDDQDYGLYGACSRKLVEILGRDCAVLDLGAGLGTASIPLAMAGAKVIAADISQKMLLYAAKSAAGKQFESNLVCARMNGYGLSIVDHCMDAVVELDMLHQVDNPEAVLQEMLRVLKPGGILVRYGCTGLTLTEEQCAIKDKCGEAFNDITGFYDKSLREFGYTGRPFESWALANESVGKRFERPEVVQTGYEEVWTEKMKYGIYKLRTRASGGAQLIPDGIHNAAWKKTDEYAAQKYGQDYVNMPGYSRYTGTLELYRIKS